MERTWRDKVLGPARKAFDPRQRCRLAPRYAVSMKPWQVDELRRALGRRRDALLDELKRADDIGDDVSADVLVELDQAELSRDAAELREIEEARRRLAEGRYGICADC